MNVFIPFERVDKTEHIVGGVATSEALDSYGTIISFSATERAVRDWEKWRNIREMHDKRKAAGIATEVKLDRSKKALGIEAKIIDPIAWAKVQAGVYKGFSVGGRVNMLVRRRDGVGVITDYVLEEISLVDRPANPDALFSLVRRSEAMEFTEEQLNVLAALWRSVAGEDTPVPEDEAQALSVLKAALTPKQEEKEPEGEEEEKAERAIDAQAIEGQNQRVSEIEKLVRRLEARVKELEEMPAQNPLTRRADDEEKDIGARIADLERTIRAKSLTADSPEVRELVKLYAAKRQGGLV